MLLVKEEIAKIRKRYAITKREAEIVTLFFVGMNDNEQIAEEIGNSFLTTKVQISGIYSKLDVHHKLQAVIKIIDECKLLKFRIKKAPKTLIEKFRKKYNLTNREIDLFLILLKGITPNKDIGKEMNIDFRCSINYLMNIYRKTFTNNKLALVIKFIDES